MKKNKFKRWLYRRVCKLERTWPYKVVALVCFTIMTLFNIKYGFFLQPTTIFGIAGLCFWFANGKY